MLIFKSNEDFIFLKKFVKDVIAYRFMVKIKLTVWNIKVKRLKPVSKNKLFLF